MKRFCSGMTLQGNQGMYSDLYQFMTKYLYPGKPLRQGMQEMERTQWLSRDELESIQLEKIQRLIRYAYENVPFYRERYQSGDIHPHDIKSLKDFSALPFLTREDVKNYREALISTGYKGRILEGQTSGSTGTPMTFVKESSAAWSSFAFNSRCRGWYGVSPGDKRAFVTAIHEDYPDWPWKKRLAANINQHRYLNVRKMTESTMGNFAEMLVKWQPVMFRAYPSSLAIFADYLKNHNIKGITPKLIETTAEKLTSPQKQLFEEVFNAPVADHYASLEIFSYAYQCPEGGLHVNEERYLELVKNDQVVSNGRIGEVAVTALDQYAMPFIRYKNGDLAIYKREICSCGRGLPALREVVGRSCDLLVNPYGRIVHWAPIIVIMMAKKAVYQYQIYQPDRHHLEVRLVCRKNINGTYLENIRNEIQPLFGESMLISLKLLDQIELTAGGKYRVIISEVKPDLMQL